MKYTKKEIQKRYRDKNKIKIKLASAKYKKENKESIVIKDKDYRKANCEKRKLYNKEYYKTYTRKRNKKQRNLLEKNKRANEPLYKLCWNARTKLNKALKRGGYTKKSSTQNMLGCSYEFLKQYIENQFESWMSWDNHGKYNGNFEFGWDIDHIKPLSSAKTEAELLMLLHYTNLQPLCSHINRDIKKDNLLFNQVK